MVERGIFFSLFALEWNGMGWHGMSDVVDYLEEEYGKEGKEGKGRE